MLTVPLPFTDSALLLAEPWPGLSHYARWPLLALVLLGPLALLALLYRYELRLLSRRLAALLLGTRLLLAAVILAVVFLRPVHAGQATRTQPGVVVVVVDRSLSMALADPQRPHAEKLRLALRLNRHAGKASDAQLADWIKAHAESRDPAFPTPELARAHDDILAEVEKLTRTDLARIVLEDDIALLAKVRERHRVELWGLHKDVWLLDAPFADAPPGGDFTDLAAALGKARRRAGEGNVLAVVLLSDGSHNAGGSPEAEAAALAEAKAPVFAVALGAREPPPDAAVLAVRGPEHTVFKDSEAVIEVAVRIAGLKAQPWKLTLRQAGKAEPLAEKAVAYDGKTFQETFRLPVKLKEPGTRVLTAELRPEQPDDRELRKDNNALSTTIAVTDDKPRVLLVDGETRWEQHYLAAMLRRDELIRDELKVVVFEQPRLNANLTDAALEKAGLPAQNWPEGEDALAKFACIVLGDVEVERLPPEKLRELERYVAETGGTLVVIAGRKAMPLAFPETVGVGEPSPLRRLLPIEEAREMAPAGGFPLSVTAGGRDVRFMTLDDDEAANAQLWAGFPRPWPRAVVGRAKPGATPLAVWLDPADAALPPSRREGKNVVMARHNYGFGRVLYSGIDGTWRWRFRADSRVHHRFWGQVIRWAAADKPLIVGNDWVRFGTPQPVYRPGDPVDVVVRLNEKVGPIRPEMLAGARLFKLPDAEKGEERQTALAPLARRPAQPRVLEGQWRDLAPGRYAIELAIPELGDRLLAPAKGGEPARPLRAVFTVLPPESRELADLQANVPLLERITARSGGRVFLPEEADGLAELLRERVVTVTEHRETKLYRSWWLLGLVVVLLGVEWGVRKWVGLP